jgi:UDP-N-acetylglucosamine--N-acetylmuramyl-(pentapeptide) pyrophosphoryl-undecaprenol N-acetylglucosamine transferase
MNKWFPASKIILTGNPVRKEIQQLAEGADLKAKALQHFGLSADKKTILVIGGSLGARTINLSIEQGLKNISDSGIQLLWQTGKEFFQQAKGDVETLNNPSIKAFAFIREMELAYSVADIVISRAGAIAISELCIAGKPSILVPSPNVAEDHQTKNAKSLADNQAALMVRDVDAQESLASTALATINDSSLLIKLSENILKRAKPMAIKEITNEIIGLMPKTT